MSREAGEYAAIGRDGKHLSPHYSEKIRIVQ